MNLKLFVAPAAPPADIRAEATSSSSVKVSWMAPPKEMRRGSIKGYYLGYKVLRSSDTFTYKTLESSGEIREEHHLTNLRRFTQYAIRLQAFNKAGSGPHSEEVTVQTLEYGKKWILLKHITPCTYIQNKLQIKHK
ncbi:down syndrome cell adhesion molecule homolog [Caerostris extrusa]|uniref:Down syndrome cell adhesion molecule homolog n=1 Tax=Caerostris extrusa TaxID=172846 RepID=A0AAV4SIP2_CAEEX|nr:down syndrome cell adhesion molecule homolog [Caerostris extrusa]